MKNFKARIEEYQRNFDSAFRKVKNGKSLQELRNTYLSRKRGYLTLLFKELKTLKHEEKPEAGMMINNLKIYIEEKLQSLEDKYRVAEKAVKKTDFTLPGIQRYWGAPHPLRLFQEEIENIFLSMGYSIEEGPEIETDYYNFEALNFPPHHPARDDWDTLYLTDDLLLRTHTSPVQIRIMEKRKPPIKIIIPGKVFRRETSDPTHLPMFYQVEGLVVDKGITFAHLKGTLEYFLKALFSEKIKIKFRPSFFPFTEPSAEVDIGCTVCEGKDKECRVCGGSGWKELLGAGMVDPQVFKNVNIDPEIYSGFAFGLGIERAAMFAYHINDMRFFYENDLRFIRQFVLK
ncbi:MAG: phenylalanine--tRNA ligase subunit alpha [Candidatus Aminicenantaceae bacterium]